MNNYVNTMLVVGALVTALNAYAHPAHTSTTPIQQTERASAEWTQQHHHARRVRHEHPHFSRRNVLRLDLPVHLRGDHRVGLKRMLKRHYRINPDHYRLKRVVIDHGRGHRGSAHLRVGRNIVDETRLHSGANHLRTGRYDQGRRWVLGLRNARVNNIRVVLEPRNRFDRHVRLGHQTSRFHPLGQHL